MTVPDEAGTGEARPVELSILVVGYNSAPFLTDCIGAVAAASARHSCEILFVNNGTDQSEALIAERFPGVRVLPSRGNVGFAEANNLLAREARGRWLVLLNPDTKLYPGAIDTLVETALANPDFWVLGGVTVDQTGAFQIHAYPELPTLGTLLRGLIGRAARPLRFEPGVAICPVNVVHGGFLLIERARWEDLGGLDEGFFLYAEDCDFSKRVADSGGRLGLVPESRIFHDIGSGSVFSPVRKRFQAAGNAHYFRKHFPGFRGKAAIGLLWAIHLTRFALGFLLSRLRPRYAGMSAGFAQTALRPSGWMRGFDSPGADPRRSGDR